MDKGFVRYSFEPNTVQRTEKTVKDYFNEFVDNLNYGDYFRPRDVVRYISVKTYATGRHRIPHDGTITRYIRARRAKHNDVKLECRVTSKYRKVEDAKEDKTN